MTDEDIRVKALEWREGVGVWTAKFADFSYVISAHDDENNVEFYRLSASVFPLPKTIGKYPSLTDAQREAQRRVGECVEVDETSQPSELSTGASGKPSELSTGASGKPSELSTGASGKPSELDLYKLSFDEVVRHKDDQIKDLQARCDELEAAAREACDQLKSLAYASHKATGRPLSKRPRTKMLQRPEKVRDNLLAVRKALRSVVEGGK